MIELELFISGSSVNSKTVHQRVNNVVKNLQRQEAIISLTVVDVNIHPERALEVGIMLTPVLVRWMPLPAKMLLGVVTEEDVIAMLELDP